MLAEDVPDVLAVGEDDAADADEDSPEDIERAAQSVRNDHDERKGYLAFSLEHLARQ